MARRPHLKQKIEQEWTGRILWNPDAPRIGNDVPPGWHEVPRRPGRPKKGKGGNIGDDEIIDAVTDVDAAIIKEQYDSLFPAYGKKEATVLAIIEERKRAPGKRQFSYAAIWKLLRRYDENRCTNRRKHK
jgi:hypothetical protein